MFEQLTATGCLPARASIICVGTGGSLTRGVKDQWHPHCSNISRIDVASCPTTRPMANCSKWADLSADSANRWDDVGP